MTVVVASVVAASGLALGGYWLGHGRASRALGQSHSADSVDKSVQDEGSGNLAGTVDHLERRLAALELRQAFAKPPEPAGAASPPHAGESERFDPAKVEERRLERVAAIEAALRTEARDRAWAPSTEGQLQVAVDTAIKAGAKFSIRTLKCFTSICDMVLSASGS